MSSRPFPPESRIPELKIEVAPPPALDSYVRAQLEEALRPRPQPAPAATRDVVALAWLWISWCLCAAQTTYLVVSLARL
jgi:hypothetical protein